METKISLSQEDLEKVFALRYQVYVEEENKFGGSTQVNDKKISDEFDVKDNTVNLLMSDNNEPIATVRYTVNNKLGEELPSDRLFDFTTIKNEHHGLIVANIGMLAIKKTHRGPRTFNSLMISLGEQLLKTENDYYLFTLNHECCNLFCRIMGAKMLNDKIWSEEIRNYIIPMIMYKDQVLNYVKRFGPKNIPNFAVC